MLTCKCNSKDARDYKTVNKCFNDPYHGQFLSTFDGIFNKASL